MAGRVLLVVPTGTYRAAAFLEAARRLGLEAVVASEEPSTLGSDELVVDLDDPGGAADAAALLAARLPVDGVVGVDESSVLVAAAIAERLGLRHHPLAAVEATRDKRLLRRRLAAASVAQPAFAETVTTATPARLATAAEAAGGFPVVAKPVGLAASRGVIRADGEEALQLAARRIDALLTALDCDASEGERPLLVERFIPGAEVAVEGLVEAGRLDVLAIFDKPDPLDGPFFPETIYVTPSRLPPATQAGVTALTATAVKALGLAEGPIHAEVRIDPLTGPRLIEVAARSIGGLCSRSLRFGGGATLEQLIVAHACGLPRPAPVDRPPGASGVLMLPVPTAGRLRSVDGTRAAAAVPGVGEVVVSAPPGSELVPLPEGDRYLGFVFASGVHPITVEHALREAWRRLDVVIDAPVSR